MKSSSITTLIPPINYSTDNHYQKVSLPVKMMRWYLKILNLISKEKALSKVKQLFLTPQNIQISKKQKKWYDSKQYNNLSVKNNEIAIWKSSSKPSVLLLHGWASSSFRLRHICEYLINNDIDLITFDFPAHGMSNGKSTNLYQMEQVIAAILDENPSINTVVGYSFGGALSLNPSEKHNIGKIITIGSPLHYQLVTHPFFNLLQVPQNIIPEFYNDLEELVGKDRDDWINYKILTNENISELIIHDMDDQIVPIDFTLQIVNQYNLTNFITRGNGHRGLLKTPEVNKKIVRFLKSN